MRIETPGAIDLFLFPVFGAIPASTLSESFRRINHNFLES
jgi:hypothetical protein